MTCPVFGGRAEPGAKSRLLRSAARSGTSRMRYLEVGTLLLSNVTVTFPGSAVASDLVIVVVLLAVLCSELKGRSSSRRLRSASRSARRVSRDRNASPAWRLVRLASLVFRSALTPEHAEGRWTARRALLETAPVSAAAPRVLATGRACAQKLQNQSCINLYPAEAPWLRYPNASFTRLRPAEDGRHLRERQRWPPCMRTRAIPAAVTQALTRRASGVQLLITAPSGRMSCSR